MPYHYFIGIFITLEVGKMDEKTQKKIERNQKIIDYNRQVLYKLNRKKEYAYLNTLFTDEVRELYLKIMKFLSGKNTNNEQFKIKIHLSTSQIIKLRGKGSENTANRYINLLCAMGLLKKVTQDKHDIEKLTKINQSFLEELNSPYIEPINTFEFFKLTDEKLEAIEQRCKVLVEHKIKKRIYLKSL